MSWDWWRVEDDYLRDAIYAELVRLHALWKAEGLDGFFLLETQADNIAADLRRRFNVKPRYTRRSDFILVQYGEAIPPCKGCFNEYGGCGTPCVNCKKAEDFYKKWKTVLHTDEFTVYKKNSELS